MELKSPLCSVRSYRPEDSPHLVRHGNNRKVWLNLRDRFPHPFTEEAGAGYIAWVLEASVQTSFAIDVGGHAIGGISLHLGTDIERIGAEVGYWIGEEFWNRGIVTQALKMITGYAFSELGLMRLFALPFASNKASCRALEKAGFEQEGYLRRSAIKDGQIVDQYLYSIIRD